jgi:hypothetical protein
MYYKGPLTELRPGRLFTVEISGELRRAGSAILYGSDIAFIGLQR